MNDAIIPIVLFVVLGIISLGFFYWNYKNRLSIIRAGSMFPLMMGIGFLLVWRLSRNQG